MTTWPVVPICEAQRLDVRPEDLVEGGLYRLCDTYRGGGGYDRFPQIARDRRMVSDAGPLHEQLVVQLRGCPLRCPYCYVTEAGYLGPATEVTTDQMVATFRRLYEERCVRVLHLMGGAPGLHIERWRDIMMRIPSDAIFTSDLLLIERTTYSPITLGEIALVPNHLIAVNIKGTSPENYRANTGREMDRSLMLQNLEIVARTGLNFYLTFTNPDEHLEEFKRDLVRHFGRKILQDSFVINLVDYRALSVKA